MVTKLQKIICSCLIIVGLAVLLSKAGGDLRFLPSQTTKPAREMTGPAPAWSRAGQVVTWLQKPPGGDDRGGPVGAPGQQRPCIRLALLVASLIAGGPLAMVHQQDKGQKSSKDGAAPDAARRPETYRLSHILQAIADAVIAVDLQGQIELLNPAAAQLTGWQPAEACGRPWPEVLRIITSESRKPATHPVNQVLQQGVLVELANNTLLIDRQEGEHWIAGSVTPIFDDQGHRCGAVLVLRDRSAARWAEDMKEFHLDLIHYAGDHSLHELIHKTLADLGTLLQSPLGFFQVVEAPGATISLPPWFYRTVAGSCQEGESRPDLLDQAGVLADCCRQGQPVIYNNCESLSQEKGLPPGHAPLERLLIVPVLRQGQVVAVVGLGNKPTPYTQADANLVATLADVAWQLFSQKRLEEELRQTNNLLDAIIENIPHMIFLKDARDLRFVRFNRAGEDLLGYSREELLGKSDNGFFPTSEADAFTSKDREVLRCRKLVDLPEEPIQTRHQGQRWLHTKKIPILGPDGQPQYLLGISVDVTGQRRLANTLERLAQTSSLDAAAIFRTLAQEVAHLLQAAATLVGRLVPGPPQQVETLAVYRNGEFLENFAYPLAATPLNLVEGCRPCLIPTGVREMFPEDRFLQETEAVGYWGLRLISREGQTVGLLAVSARQTLTISPQEASLLQILAARATAEIERHQSLLALQQQQAFLRQVIDAVDAFIYVKAADGRYLLANHALARAYSTTVAELEGRRAEDFCPNLEECRKFQRDDLQVMRERRMLIIPEEQFIFADGSVHWLTTVKRPLLEPDGSCDKLLAVAMDITHHKQSEAEQERLLAAIEQAGEAIVITDTQGAIQYVNPAFELATGYGKQEVLGQNPRILKSGLQDQAFYQNLWQTITAGRTWRGRLVNRRRDGTLFTEDATISPVFDRNGQIVSYVAVKKNISVELEMERQLYQAQKLESVGRLAGGLAHDFNNMLSVIIGYAELLEKQISPEQPPYQLIEEIRRAGLRSRALTQQLLAFSRQQSQQLQILDLNMIITTLERMVQRLIGEDIDLVTVLAPNLGAVRADQNQIEQVLINLIVNARDAMPQGGRLTIRTANVELPEPTGMPRYDLPPGPYVLVEVSDTGVGMEEATQDKIFEPFFTTKEPGQGTGLGLAMVYGIVKQSGGDIRCTSRLGQGTTFTILLPCLDIPAKAATSPGLPREKLGNQEHILVVEDEEPVRQLLDHMLRVLNYRTTLASNGEEALRLLVQEGLRPDLLLTDTIMPKMGGKQLWAAVRQLLPDLKVIFISGYVADRTEEPDATIPFLAKPFSLHLLSAKIQEVLEKK
ncbi:MAG: PAS domain S-box protein [Desulfobacca sp.]|uniref:PAS domain S-box protein n=1 Tax=Desulfobacca sp. TaxID=2067990 RepID=UPI00404B2014